MATQTVRLNLGRLSGTFTADVYLDGSNTTFATDRAMSAEVQPGFYAFTLSSSSGVYSVIVKESSVRIGSWWVKTADTAATFHAADTRDEVVSAGERATLATASAQSSLQASVDDVPTTAEIATALLVTPANKLATNASGYVTSTNGGGGGGGEVDLTQDALDAIGEVVVANLPTGPAMMAAANVAGGNTYCTVADVESRLTAYGVTWLADAVTPDGTRQSGETTLIERAIDYCNSIIDMHIQSFVNDITTRPAGNVWLRDRCIDLSCVRVFTLGGRDVPPVLKDESEKAMAWLKLAQKRDVQIPSFPYRSQILPETQRKTGTPTVVRF